MKIRLNQKVSEALSDETPLVALESTVISHGLPYPVNLETAKSLEQNVIDEGATPATIAVFEGEFCAGISNSELEKLATNKNIRKISRRDLAIAYAKKLNCATTVATTMFVANQAGIKVFATGGIGGVHRGIPEDVSADLNELANTPMITVCSGAKIVLDLSATREWLETNGVTILGYQCDELPAFYSRSSGLFVDERVDSVDEVVEIANARNRIGLRNAILVTVPVPDEFEIERSILENILAQSISLAEDNQIKGKELTPFLLSKMAEISEGKTLAANIALLKNNAKVAAQIAVALSRN